MLFQCIAEFLCHQGAICTYGLLLGVEVLKLRRCVAFTCVVAERHKHNAASNDERCRNQNALGDLHVFDTLTYSTSLIAETIAEQDKQAQAQLQVVMQARGLVSDSVCNMIAQVMRSQAPSK